LGKIAPQEGHQEKEANSGTIVVETTTSPQRTPTQHHQGHHGKESQENGRENSQQIRAEGQYHLRLQREGQVDLEVLPKECGMLAGGLARLAITPIGNVQLGKKVATTHHQGRHHQSAGLPRKEIAK